MPTVRGTEYITSYKVTRFFLNGRWKGAAMLPAEPYARSRPQCVLFHRRRAAARSFELEFAKHPSALRLSEQSLTRLCPYHHQLRSRLEALHREVEKTSHTHQTARAELSRQHDPWRRMYLQLPRYQQRREALTARKFDRGLGNPAGN